MRRLLGAATVPVVTAAAVATVAAVVLLGLLAPGPARAGAALAGGSEGRGRAVLVLVPGLTWPELAQAVRSGAAPNLTRLAGEGALALMNVRTGGRGDAGEAYLSIGAGARLAGMAAAGEAYERGESPGLPAADVYRQRTGREPPPGGVLHVSLPALEAGAAALPYAVRLAGLGQALAEAGVRRVVLGNADRFGGGSGAGGGGARGERGRFAAALAMDALGSVDEGHVGLDTLAYDPGFPGGWRTDEERLSALARETLARPRPVFLTVETGDLWRLEAEAAVMAPAPHAAARAAALARADRILGGILAAVDRRRDLVVVASPQAGLAERGEGYWVAPLVAWGAGLPPSFLASPTTRREGFVANVDLAPSVLAFFGLPAPGWAYGRPWHPVGVGTPLAERLASLDALDAVLHGKQRAAATAVKAYIGAQILAAAATVAVLAGARLPGAAPILAWSWLWLAAVPLAMLLLAPRVALVGSLLSPAAFAAGVGAAALGLAAGAALVAGGAARAGGRDGRRSYGPFALLAVLTAAAVAADAATGSRLMEASLLGHSLAGGARYYGIGNEYMGVLLGAALLVGGALLELWPGAGGRRAALAGWCAAVYLLGSPALGANLGGAVAAAVALAFLGLRVSLPHLNRRATVAAVALAAVAAVTVFAGLDLRLGEGGSHVAALAREAEAGRWGGVADTVTRKLAMNLRLLRWTNWSLALVAYVVTAAWLAARPAGRLRALLHPFPGLALALAGVPLAALAALLANDSGVVAAATTMVFGTAPLAALALMGPEGTWVRRRV